MAREVLVDLDGELFPDIDADHPPQDLNDWIKHFCHGDEGALRLRDLLRNLGDRGFDAAQRKRLHEHFAVSEERITEDQIDKLLYQPRPLRLGKERLELIVRYLWDEGLLPVASVRQSKPGDAILRDLHESLVGFLDVSESSLIELEERLPGRYWIYRPSAHHPGKYMKGLLTVQARHEPGGPLAVSEDYRVPADPAAGEYGLRHVYEGLTLQKSNRPFMLLILKLPTHRNKPQGQLQEADVAVLRVTLITAAQMHVDGKIASMLGFTAATYAAGGFLASPVCFERIPPDYPGSPEKDLKVLGVEQVSSSVLSRISSFVTAHGLIRW